jgi:hypothetical protein
LAAKAKGEKLTDGMNDLLDCIVEVIDAPKGLFPPTCAAVHPLPTVRHTQRPMRYHLSALLVIRSVILSPWDTGRRYCHFRAHPLTAHPNQMELQRTNGTILIAYWWTIAFIALTLI